jgi:hypothetical protein
LSFHGLAGAFIPKQTEECQYSSGGKIGKVVWIQEHESVGNHCPYDMKGVEEPMEAANSVKKAKPD